MNCSFKRLGTHGMSLLSPFVHAAQGLRSFGRLFSFILPPFYAPYYAELAKNLNSLGVGIVFSVLTAIALNSLFETSSQMEEYVAVSVVSNAVRRFVNTHYLCALFSISPFVETSLLDGIQGKF